MRDRASAAAPPASISAARPTMCAGASTTSTRCTASGHEIASHAVGHFNGSGWSAAEWAKEFRAFNDVAAKVGPNNGFGDAVKLAFPLTEIRGFRAPYLAKSAGLFTALRNAASATTPAASAGACLAAEDRRRLALRSRQSAHQRQRQGHDLDGLQFPGRAVRRLPEPGSRRAARSSASRWCRPISIISRRIMPAIARRCTSGIISPTISTAPIARRCKTFARTVCGLPEVRCTTYAQLADFMDAQHPTRLRPIARAISRARRSRPSDSPQTGALTSATPCRRGPPPSRASRICA